MIITLDDLIGYNKYVCECCNEEHLVINKDNLLSAIGIQQWYDNPCEQAAAIFRSVIIGHGFKDGNKRTAVIALISICEPSCSNSVLESTAIKVATGEMKEITEIVNALY